MKQLFKSFICFLVDCTEFKIESYLSLIICWDDSIESRHFDEFVVIYLRIGSCLAYVYQVMEHVGSLESTREA